MEIIPFGASHTLLWFSLTKWSQQMGWGWGKGQELAEWSLGL